MNRRVETITLERHILECYRQGRPYLVMHGGHSNCYEEFGYKARIEQGYSIITPSMSGYGQTSKEIGNKQCLFSVIIRGSLT
ncbi:hypothetical protein J7E23_13995 [Pseudomonas sp. ISL-88]|uniref:hypothetical protein n=1 Tax=Pseudomonas sp. ISL-88 TaxID=2819169 RepID=UPI001BEB22B2|nr:hypothetical protein [Pseudomonas sp. ISL-88]MBT2713956.1 hypothetical protein [Pseudomonas sp. ISL-88]